MKINLTPKLEQTFKDQILLVLADYQNSNRNLTQEGTRIEIAKRVVANLKAVATAAGIRSGRKL